MNTTLVGQEVSVNMGEPMTFRGVYHNVRYYESHDKKIHCLFDCTPKCFDSVRQLQHAVRKWENEDNEDPK